MRQKKQREVAAFRRIEMFSFLVLMLQFTEESAQNPHPFAATLGVDVSLPCKNVTYDQGKCDRTTWTFSPSINTVTLFEHGEIHKDAGAKSDRLRVMEDCSLEVRMVKAEDAGRYVCTQFNKSGQKHGDDTMYVLSVISFQLTIPTIKSTSTSTNTSRTATPATTKATSTKAWTNTPASTASDRLTEPQVWWYFIIVAAVLAVLIITVVAVCVCKRPDENRTQMHENIADPEDGPYYTSIRYTRRSNSNAQGMTSNPAGTQTGPESNQDMADPEDGLYYASIRYTRKSNSNAQVQDEVDPDDDDGEVTYSTVKVSSSPAEASTDLSDLYATVKKPNK